MTIPLSNFSKSAQYSFEHLHPELLENMNKTIKPLDLKSEGVLYHDPKKKEDVVSIDGTANYILGKFKVKTVYGLRDEKIYLYIDGIWIPQGRALLKSFIERLLKSYAKNNVVSEVLEKIKRITATPQEEFEETEENLVCLLNGVLDLRDVDNIRLLPHSEDYYFRTKLLINHIPEATCPKCIQFIEDTFYPSDVKTFQEWWGFHLNKRYAFKKAVILFGPQDTGKSVTVNLLSRFLGESNVSSLTLQKISVGKGFDLLCLKDKKANISDDLSSKDLQNAGAFKMAVGDGFISGEEKFGDSGRFRNTAKHTFTCNQIPSVKDIDDSAYYSRWIIFAIDNVITKEEKDPNLLEKLTTPEELSGLLNWAIEGYKRLVKQNGFSNEKTADEIKALMVRNGNPLSQFVSDILVKKEGSTATKEFMYKVYCEFCEKNKLSPCSKEQLGRQLQRFATYAVPSKSGSERYWLNVDFNSSVKDTWDTFKNNMSILGEEDNIKDILIPKESQPSQKEGNLDTWDTSSKKDMPIPKFEAEEVQI